LQQRQVIPLTILHLSLKVLIYRSKCCVSSPNNPAIAEYYGFGVGFSVRFVFHLILSAVIARLAERLHLMRVINSTSSDYSYAVGGYFVGSMPWWFVVSLGDNSKSPLY